ncbi:DNA polymerase III subunit psi [Polynucleobacter sp. UB-Tiil-W10]|uniref:DNA polymerase III subunit psi n=1 Tax=Polynucleobacter sp. UB-Tiil-W10 TaxID=1855648 RepID=UPI001C0D9280|nr:DNA polymerase III subunit psi [Polynucleobacter sp. UB-Tiil-W10]MBU3541447.1 DNA polymerase III subunit psi [Polynucleobacter sp. UB-Tiil-W10]
MTNNHSTFLKEMGITEWTSRDAVKPLAEVAVAASIQNVASDADSAQRSSYGSWWFFGNEPQGDAQILFQNIIRVLGLARNEWSWKSASDNLSQLSSPESPVVVVAFGGSVAQKITGERDPLPQLRETVLALKTGNDEEIPVIASFELNQVLTKPKEKALLWQDLLLARSVLQNS